MKQKTKRMIAKFLRVVLGPPKRRKTTNEIDWHKALEQFFGQANKAIEDGCELKFIGKYETDTEITLCARFNTAQGAVHRIERRMKKC